MPADVRVYNRRTRRPVGRLMLRAAWIIAWALALLFPAIQPEVLVAVLAWFDMAVIDDFKPCKKESSNAR